MIPAARRPRKGLFDRIPNGLGRRASRSATDESGLPLDLDDAGGIPRSFKILFVLGVLVLVPLLIGAAFVVLILLRIKLTG